MSAQEIVNIDPQPWYSILLDFLYRAEVTPRHALFAAILLLIIYLITRRGKA
jgi:hypothetical protein